jgi:hypothetical protein
MFCLYDRLIYSKEQMDVITLDGLLSSVEVLKAKEANDKVTLESLGTLSASVLEGPLMQWAANGFPESFQIFSFTVVAPEKCSDGVKRPLDDYMVFCSGKSLQDHVDVLQNRMKGIHVSFANFGTHLGLVVSRPVAVTAQSTAAIIASGPQPVNWTR